MSPNSTRKQVLKCLYANMLASLHCLLTSFVQLSHFPV